MPNVGVGRVDPDMIAAIISTPVKAEKAILYWLEFHCGIGAEAASAC